MITTGGVGSGSIRPGEGIQVRRADGSLRKFRLIANYSDNIIVFAVPVA